MKIRTHHVDETRAVAAALAAVLRPGDVVVLAGELGGGKTAFVQGACSALGVTEPVTSPTFAIVQEYTGHVPIAHIDVYRLERLQELHDLGFDELVDAGRITFVEWGDRVASAMPADHIVVAIGLPDDLASGLEPLDDDRLIRLSVHGPHWPERARQIATALAHFLHPDDPTGSASSPDAAPTEGR